MSLFGIYLVFFSLVLVLMSQNGMKNSYPGLIVWKEPGGRARRIGDMGSNKG
jgi:hypothetical protein